MKKKPLLIKFGGAAVATPKHIERIADIIIQKKEHFNKIVVVLSAMGNTTNDLIALAKEIHPDPPQREYDMLLTVGERISISLLAMALHKRGENAKSFTGSQSGIITTHQHSNAEIIDVRPHRLLQALETGHIAIVAGFQGVSIQGEITTLGRGGSDTTAVALAVGLNAEKVEFYKDVSGIYSSDPKIDAQAILYDRLSYDQALDIIRSGSKILHKRSLILAKKNGIKLHVLSFIDEYSKGTIVGDSTEIRCEPIYESGVLSHV